MHGIYTESTLCPFTVRERKHIGSAVVKAVKAVFIIFLLGSVARRIMIILSSRTKKQAFTVIK